MTSTPAGWYPDTSTPGQQRYWDGAAWTEHVAPLQQQAAPQVQQNEPGVIWQTVGKPLKGFGGGRYKLTEHYLFFERGTLRTDSQQVPIANVFDVDMVQTMAQKARNVATIRAHIQRPQGIELVLMEDIVDARDGVRLINETAHAARAVIQRNQNTHRYETTAAPMAAAPAPVATPEPAVDPMAQLQKLGELRDAGVLTEDEFNAKKADILSRM